MRYLRHIFLVTVFITLSPILSACASIQDISASWEDAWHYMFTHDITDISLTGDSETDSDDQTPDNTETHNTETGNPAENNTANNDEYQAFATYDAFLAESNTGSTDVTPSANPVKTGQTPCPQYDIVQDLSQLHQFYDPDNPEPGQRIAEIKISDMTMSCTMHEGDMILDINIDFNALIGPKSRIFETDQPSISYPYFMAVTNKQGQIFNKVIHGVSMTFNAMEVHKQHREHIKEIISLERHDGIDNMMILIGFQLTEQELSYNRSLQQPSSDSAPVQITAPEQDNQTTSQ